MVQSAVKVCIASTEERNVQTKDKTKTQTCSISKLLNLSPLWISLPFSLLSSLSPSDAHQQCRTLSELVLILLPEAVSSWEEVPASLWVHLPHVWFLKDRKEDNIVTRRQKRPQHYFMKPTFKMHACLPTCPVCSVSSLLIRYIRKNLQERNRGMC